MDAVTDPQLQNLQVNLHGLQTNVYQPNHPNLSSDLDPSFDQNNFGAYALNSLANASVNHHQQSLSQNDIYAQSPSQLQLQPRARFQARSDGSPNGHSSYAQSQNSASSNHDDPYNAVPSRLQFGSHTSMQNGSPQQPLYMPIQRLQQQQQQSPVRHGFSPTTPSTPTLNGISAKEEGTSSHFSGMKVVKDPPNLAEWRDRLFNIVGTITMTEEEFQIYFPHIDNVYSHRSTQKYKRRPFVSHYWDCRLKGRPSGTPKSDDPTKKKRKRTARKRDLCDVKIKITEYFPINAGEWAQSNSAGPPGTHPDGSNLTFISENQNGNNTSSQAVDPAQPFGVLAPSPTLPPGHPGATGARYYTVQMVNGNLPNSNSVNNNDPESPSNTTAGPFCLHKHTLADSDKIKKNSVQRHHLKLDKEAKRLSTTTNSLPSNPQSHPPGSATGLASKTKHLHALTPSPTSIPGGTLTLFANSYCPFAQRIWIALEIKRLPYQYVEVIPAHMVGGSHERPAELLEVCPEGTVPCLRHGKWAVWESGVCLEYLEELTAGLGEGPMMDADVLENWLLPPGDARLRAWSRLWVDHINRKILPAFYHLLLLSAPQHSNPATTDTSTAPSFHSVLTATLTRAITSLVNASHATGPFFLGPRISYVDVAFAPWVLRLSRVLARYRGYTFSSSALESRWQAWVRAIESDERVKATTSEAAAYESVYAEVGECGMEALMRKGIPMGGEKKLMAEMAFAKGLVGEEGFGLGGDVWGREVDYDSRAFRESGKEVGL